MQLRTLLSPSATKGNPKLAAALERLREEPTRQRRGVMLETLRAGPLLLAVRELPECFDPAVGEAAELCLLTAEVPGAGKMLCAFSGTAALTARAPAALALWSDPTQLAEWMLALDLEGLILDAGGAAAVLSRDEVRGLLGLEPLSPRRSTSPDDPENTVRGALEGLLGEEGRERLRIREPRTGKSIWLEQAGDGQLLLVLPGADLAPDERARAEMLFDELAGADLPEAELEKPDDGGAPDPDFQALFAGDIDRPARAAVKIFSWVFGFPPGFDVETDRTSGEAYKP